MNTKRVALPLTILGLLFAAAVALLPRSVHRPGILPAEDTSVARNDLPPQLPPRRTSNIAPKPNSDLHLRTFRPSPVDAYRNSERSGYAWILRQMGMSESDLDLLASGAFVELLNDLMKKADQGDRSAIRSLGWLARRCVVKRSDDQLNGYQQSQLQDARLLPPADAAWFSSFLNQDIDTDRQRITECTVIDQDFIDALLTGLSRQGDGASTFILADQANNLSDMNRLARQAAIQGFPEGQYEWALDLLNGPGFWHPEPGDPSAVDFLRSAAEDLATARASLAICEYRGSSGETPDPEQAVLDARTAAQQGDPDAIVSLASTAPPSLISPTEAEARALFDVALQQRGCRVSTVSVNWMKAMAAQTAKATPDAQALADQNWQRYGASAMQSLGC